MLACLLVSHAPATLSEGEAEDLDRLEERLRGLIAECERAWPGLGVPAEDFAAYLGARLSGPSLEAALEAVHVTDLYLACACSRGSAAALQAFEEALLSKAGAMLARQRVTPAQLDEVRQRVRERLFVAEPDEAPKIGEYRGRGALSGWVRIIVVRTALNLRRNMDDKLAERESAEPAELALVGADPESDLLRRRYREEFKAAFQEALRGLPAEQRNLLRLSLIDGLSVERLAGLFQMSRATAARRVAAARDAVVTQTKRILQERLRLSPSEIKGLANLVRSQLDLSMSRCLARLE